MADLYGRLVAAGRPAEAHFFGFGEHGTGFALGDPLLGEWPSLLVSWMRTSGLLTTSQRTALREASGSTASRCRAAAWS